MTSYEIHTKPNNSTGPLINSALRPIPLTPEPLAQTPLSHVPQAVTLLPFTITFGMPQASPRQGGLKL